jgi:hypothetical protein
MSERANAPGEHVDQTFFLDVQNHEQSTQARVSFGRNFVVSGQTSFRKNLLFAKISLKQGF